MVQLFYYENRGKCCRKLWKHDGNKLKVYLHAEESWAETALASFWMIKPSPWYIKLSQNWRGRPRKFVVEEHMGSKVRTGNAVMIDNGPQGVLWVRGAFNRKDKSIPSPYFKLTLTSHVSPEDFQLGYSMTGLVERSGFKYVNFQTTHLAFVRRSQQQHEHPFLGDQQDENKSKHLNKSFLANLEFTKRLTNNHHHSLDNQYQSAQRLRQNLQNERCDSTSSDSSTSTLVEDGFRNDEMFNKNDEDFILVLPKVSISSFVECEKQKNTSSTKVSSNKKCCSVQCIDSMSTVSSVCPSCTTPVSNCFKKSPLPFEKEVSSRSRQDEKKEDRSKEVNRKSSSYSMQASSSVAKPNFPHFIKNGFSPYKKISSKETKWIKTSSNQRSSENPGVHQFLKSPFKEWLL